MVAVAIALRVETLVVAGYHFGDFQHRVVVQLGQGVFLLQRLSCNRRCCGAGRLLSCGGGLVMLCLNDMASIATNTITGCFLTPPGRVGEDKSSQMLSVFLEF